MAERRFGPYTLVHQIAVGGMAEIHLARAQGIAGFEKYVAIKMIHPNFSQDQQFIQMLIDEAKITVQLQHVNIAQTFDLGRVDQTYYITMEFVDGADLYKLLRRSAEADVELPIPVAAFIAKEVATGLDYAHRKRDLSGRPLGIVHRDVSPQNVLISHAGEVKLVDFGIAKATMRARQTQAGVIKGKYYYMSPEQSQGDVVDHRTDIFSAGIVLYEMLTGQMLYLEEDLHKLLDMVRRADIAPPSTLRRDVPPQLERIVMHALAKRAEDRYRTAGDLATDLERFLHGHAPVFTSSKVASWMTGILGAPVPIAPPPVEPEPTRRRSTGRFSREQLAHTREDFIDEHSVIRQVPRFDDGHTLDGPTEVPAAPVAEPRGAVSRKAPLAAAPSTRADTRPDGPGRAPGASGLTRPSPLPARDKPAAAAGPGARPLRPLPIPPRSKPGPARPSPAGPAARAPHDDTRQVQGRAPAREAPARFGELSDEHTMVSAPPGFDSPSSRSAQDETRVAGKAAPSRDDDGAAEHDETDDTGARPASRFRATGVDDAATAIRPALDRERDDLPTSLHEAADDDPLTADETRVNLSPDPSGIEDIRVDAAGSFDASMPSDLDLVTGEPTMITATPGSDFAAEGATRTGGWEAVPALAARIQKPAVSELRAPRQSRRTPAEGVPAGPSDHSVLSSILTGDGRVPQIAMAGPSQPGPPLFAPRPDQPIGPLPLSYPAAPRAQGFGLGPNAPGSPFPTAGSYPGGPGTFTSQLQAIELDEIPDSYKIRRGAWLSPLRIGVIALLLAGLAAGILFMVYRGDGAGPQASTVIKIVSSPPGATVTIDGAAHPEKTPTEYVGRAGDRHLVGVELPRYQRWQREASGSDETMIARLDPITVVLKVTSTPAEAEVFINGAPTGRTPIELGGLDPLTTKVIEVRHKCCVPVRQVLEWGDRESEKSLDFPLQK